MIAPIMALALASEAIKDGNNDQAKDWLAKAVEWDPHNEPARRQVVADVAAEIPAAEAPYSTFSLSISDASFKMAQAALAKRGYYYVRSKWRKRNHK